MKININFMLLPAKINYFLGFYFVFYLFMAVEGAF